MVGGRRRLASVHSALSCGAADERAALPHVTVIGTGGTIAGAQKQEQRGTLGQYRAGSLKVGSLVAGLPQVELSEHATVGSEQFLNVASPAITPAHWIALSRRINELFSSPNPPAGVVVTHGTDRLEETAFWLYLTVASDRPVVIVGAQRPATGLSPDGPVNLLSAIRVAASPLSVGMGALVVMDDRIMSARECRKLYPRVVRIRLARELCKALATDEHTALITSCFVHCTASLSQGGFGVGEGMGMLGVVNRDGVNYFFAPARRCGAATEFAPEPQQSSDHEEESTLPRVELVFSYPGGDGPILHDDTVGLVVVTTSGFAPGEREAFAEIRRRGVVVVTCFPSGDHASPSFREWHAKTSNTESRGGRTESIADANMENSHDATTKPTEAPMPPMVQASHLLPAKARILLMCALTKTRDPVQVQKYFSQY